ncbi:WD40-repeat-containing domain protein [Trichoderma chlorosporum]
MPSKHRFRSRLRGLFSSSDDASTQGAVIRQDESHAQPSTTALLARSSALLVGTTVLPRRSISVTPSTIRASTYSMPASLAERLWDQAYDDLKIKNAKLMQAYERILSSKLSSQGFDILMNESRENIIAQNDTNERRNQMRQLIQEGLKKTAKEARVKEAIGTATEFIFSAKEIISNAVQAVPQAALAWTGVCVALEMLQNPIAATEANRKGIEYVTKKMDWYWKLSSAVLKDNINDTSIAEVRRELETQVIDLYKALLSYEIKCVCSYYRNRGLVLLRDMAGLDDWNGDIQAIENAERVFHNESNAYTTLQMVSNLGQLVTHAEKQSIAQMTKEDQQCIKDLRVTDPREDKKRIEQTKGGLLQESYTWILHNPEYREWWDSGESRLLWIKGDPGKGKTMLLCGIIDELNRQPTHAGSISYFFFQATDQHINNATAALRGLIFMLVNQQPSLMSHLRKKYDQAGGKLFEGPNAWIALSDIFTAILQDPELKSTCLLVDALDECVFDFEKLLDLIVLATGIECPVKWVVSSRNWPQIEERFQPANQKVKLSLELNAKSISNAVNIYIGNKVEWLSNLKNYDGKTRSEVKDYLSKNANDTFLWVALVCQNLEKYSRWKVLAKLESFPPGLDSLYDRMMAQILNLEDEGDSSLCKEILAVIMSVYRPITLQELGCLVEIRQELSVNLNYLEDIVVLCGSFLNIRGATIYLIHQSAKDHLSRNEDVIFPSSRKDVHHSIFSLSLQAMNNVLKKNIHALPWFGLLPQDTIFMSDTDPLAAVRYSCVHWVDHLREGCSGEANGLHRNDLEDDGVVYAFLRKHLLHWIEALGILQQVSAGVISITVLKGLVATYSSKGELRAFLQDAHRFVLYVRRPIEMAPLQIYSSALAFSPLQSLVRKTFCQEKPPWIQNITSVEENWSPCLQTLEGHAGSVNSVAFSADHQHIVSGSTDKTIKIWDIATGACIQTLDGHTGSVNSVAFLPDSRQIVSGSSDKTIKIWDITKGMCDQTLRGHSGATFSIAVLTNGRLAAASSDRTVKIWDLLMGACVQTLKGHTMVVRSVAFSSSQQIISGSDDTTIKVWDIATGACVQTLEGHRRNITAVACLATGQVASGSVDSTVKIWDIATGACIQTLNDHINYVISVAFLSSQRAISGATDSTIKIWDVDTGENIQVLKGHKGAVNSVVPLANGQLASGSTDGTVKIWDVSMDAGARNSHTEKGGIISMVLSLDKRQVASASYEKGKDIKIWDMDTGACVQTLEGHTSWVTSIIFLTNNQVVSASQDRKIQLWDLNTGNCIQTLKHPYNKKIGRVRLASSADGKYLASMESGTIKIWDIAAGWKSVHIFGDHSDEHYSAAFSMDARRLVTGSTIETAKVWDVTTGTCIQRLEGHTRGINSVAFTANDLYIASNSDDGTVRIWDVATGACILTLDVGTVYHLSFDSTTNSRLHSDLGTLDLDLDLDSVPITVKSRNKPPLQRAVICGYGISKHLAWVTKDRKPLLWLPAEYRPIKSLIVGSTVVVGCLSGRVLILKFSETEADL